MNDGATPSGAPERRIPGKLYGRTATEITGQLQTSGNEVRYRTVLTGRPPFAYR
jgi:cellulose synthase (UDP-forming)